MIKRIIRRLFGVCSRSAADCSDELQRAVAALLVEVARSNDGSDTSEHQVVQHLLASHFRLSPEEARALLTTAEDAVRRSTQMLGFTETVIRCLAPGDRRQIMEILWRVAYADGRLEPEEDALLRRIGVLIGVGDSDRMKARRHALAHVGHIGPG